MKHLAKVMAFVCLQVGVALGADVPTYTKEIAPILWNNCAGCHRPGEIGPFSLLTYQDAAKRSSFIDEITASRKMPPWKPEDGFGSFHDQRRLTDQEIATIAAWAEAGAPEGDPEGPCPPPRSSPTAGSTARPTWCSRSPSRSTFRRAGVTSTDAS